jgi:hypothetical protein
VVPDGGGGACLTHDLLRRLRTGVPGEKSDRYEKRRSEPAGDGRTVQKHSP